MYNCLFVKRPRLMQGFITRHSTNCYWHSVYLSSTSTCVEMKKTPFIPSLLYSIICVFLQATTMVHGPLNICTVPPYIVQYHPVVISVPTICHPVNDSLQKVLANVRLYYMVPYWFLGFNVLHTCPCAKHQKWYTHSCTITLSSSTLVAMEVMKD